MENNKIKLKLGKEISEEFFYNALCNGLPSMRSYDLEFSYNSKEYIKSRDKLNNPCYEDVLMQMLKDGYKLTLIDNEYGGIYTKSISLDDVHKKVQKTDLLHIINMINEQDDAETADCILQTVFFDNIIFG